MTTQTTVRPSVWIGCLSCYNAGSLVGNWYPAEEAGDITPEDIHDCETSHEELWIFDHEGLGLRVKMCVWLGVSRGLDLAFLNAD